ncbi:hypothetical protein [Celeribacter sp. ULVN23_4]
MENSEYTQYEEAFALKTSLERILGHEEWLRLKDTRSIGAWRKSLLRALKSSSVAINSTVKVADDQWRDEAQRIIRQCEERLRTVSTIREAFAVIAACYIELSFHQLGFCPDRQGSHAKVRAIDAHWNLSTYRSVQYVQNEEQALWHEYHQDHRSPNEKLFDERYKRLRGTWPQAAAHRTC